MGRYKRCFHKFFETNENRRQPKYITKTSCYKTFRKKRAKRYIKNWRPISLLNIDTEISKAFAAKFKPILPSLSLQIKLRMWKIGVLVKVID